MKEFFDSVIRGSIATVPLQQRPQFSAECQDVPPPEDIADSGEGGRGHVVALVDLSLMIMVFWGRGWWWLFLQSLTKVFVLAEFDFLEEIRREEAEKAARLKKELEDEKREALEAAKKQPEKKKSSKKKKKKGTKTEL